MEVHRPSLVNHASKTCLTTFKCVDFREEATIISLNHYLPLLILTNVSNLLSKSVISQHIPFK